MEQAISTEAAERENVDQIMAGSIESTLIEMSGTTLRMTDEREISQIQLVESFKEMLKNF